MRSHDLPCDPAHPETRFAIHSSAEKRAWIRSADLRTASGLDPDFRNVGDRGQPFNQRPVAGFGGP